MNIAIVGGCICGLSLAMNLHRQGIACQVYERAPEIRELGVGITLLPHAMREFDALGVAGELLRTGIENVESCFFNRFGQLIYKEPRGKLAGYRYPEVGIHRGRLHLILYKAALARLGAGGKILVSLRVEPPAGVIDHFAIGVKGFNKDAVTRDLKEMGLTPQENLEYGFHVKDPDGANVQITGI